MCWHWHNNIGNPPWQPLQLNARRKRTTYFLYTLHTVSPQSLPVFQPRWLLELISSRYQLCLSHPAEQQLMALRLCHLDSSENPQLLLRTPLHWEFAIEVLRHSEPGSCQGHPSHLVGSCPIVSLLCFASVQLKEMWNPQPQSLWVYQVWMSSLSACFKAVLFRKHQDFVFEWCKSAAWQWKHQVLLRFESVVAENTSYADWRWQLSLLLVLKFVSLSIFSLIRTTVLTSSITLSSVPLGMIQRTCLGDLFWDYRDS